MLGFTISVHVELSFLPQNFRKPENSDFRNSLQKVEFRKFTWGQEIKKPPRFYKFCGQKIQDIIAKNMP